MAKYEIRVQCLGDTLEDESELARAIASEFLRMGVSNITVVADDEQVDYVDGEVHPTSPANLFRSDPKSRTDVFVIAHGSPTVN